jgi:hypothetical protein
MRRVKVATLGIRAGAAVGGIGDLAEGESSAPISER